MAFDDRHIDRWTLIVCVALAFSAGLPFVQHRGWSSSNVFTGVAIGVVTLAALIGLAVGVKWVLERCMFRRR